MDHLSPMIFLSLLAAGQVTTPVDFKDGSFLLGPAEDHVEISVDEHTAPALYPADALSLNIGSKKITINDKGLTIEEGAFKGTSTFASLPLQPKICSAAEIANNRAMIASGKRKAAMSGVAGYQTIGTDLYLLVRWADADGPWLEALVKMNLSEVKPVASFVTRLPGFSFAAGVVDDRLMAMGATLGAMVQAPDGWGLATYAPATSETTFKLLGKQATTARAMQGGTWIAGLLATDYGATRVTMVDASSGQTLMTSEVKGDIKGLVEPRYLRYIAGGKHMLLNLETGAEKEIPSDSALASTAYGLLVWWPAREPKHAGLYDSLTYRPSGYWNAP